jgi:hypothetical protein
MIAKKIAGTYGKPDRFFIDHVEVTEAEWHRAIEESRPASVAGGRPGDSFCGWSRPIASDAMAVHPDQIPEVIERNKRHGILVDYDGEGRPLLTDREQRRKLMHLEGIHDKDGGYGDDHATPSPLPAIDDGPPQYVDIDDEPHKFDGSRPFNPVHPEDSE